MERLGSALVGNSNDRHLVRENAAVGSGATKSPNRKDPIETDSRFGLLLRPSKLVQCERMLYPRSGGVNHHFGKAVLVCR